MYSVKYYIQTIFAIRLKKRWKYVENEIQHLHTSYKYDKVYIWTSRCQFLVFENGMLSTCKTRYECDIH